MKSVNKNITEFINPYSAIVFAGHIFKQKPITAEEDWILLNVALINDIGANNWLKELLEVLSLSRVKYDGHDIINTSLVIKVSGSLQGKHQPKDTEQQWIQLNEKLIDKLGTDKWLKLLLESLKNGI